ncbi:MAG: tRNA uridine(34) 5-carboxymethylaminomethyl modification radical SAM/GNAT enzyme Elp3 [Candidatus Aenigmatarchaeota archaeon]
MEKAIREIIRALKEDRENVNKIIREISRKYKLGRIPKKIEILKFCNEGEKKIKETLVKRPIRSISGVLIITIAVKPKECVWGKCIYCPTFENASKSYIGTEPVIKRALLNKYDPFLQTRNRIEHYKAMGHLSENGNKFEIIAVGGTFTGFEEEYQEWFIKRVFDALNEEESKSLEEAKKLNEKAKHRCVGLSVETRPDFCKEKHIDKLLEMGVTRVEIGAQSIFDDILKIANRGHKVKDIEDAIRMAKDSGFKVVLHLMPGLPGSSFERDLEMFENIFNNPSFIPDELKIYPTMVLKGTRLYKMWKSGKYKPMSKEETIKLLVEAKRRIPPFMRIRRILRDYSLNEVDAGPKIGNLREILLEELRKIGERCKCTRCREVGHMKRFGMEPREENIKLVRRDYEASEGREIFISFEDIKQDILISFLRLRIPSDKAHRKEINEKPSAIVREMHTYGKALAVGEKGEGWQHKGYGKSLLREAERIAMEEFDKKKIVVIAGVGVKQYFLKQGYFYDGPYVSKILS